MIFWFVEILIIGLFLSYGFYKNFILEVYKLDSGNIGYFENFNIFC